MKRELKEMTVQEAEKVFLMCFKKNPKKSVVTCRVEADTFFQSVSIWENEEKSLTVEMIGSESGVILNKTERATIINLGKLNKYLEDNFKG